MTASLWAHTSAFYNGSMMKIRMLSGADSADQQLHPKATWSPCSGCTLGIHPARWMMCARLKQSRLATCPRCNGHARSDLPALGLRHTLQLLPRSKPLSCFSGCEHRSLPARRIVTVLGMLHWMLSQDLPALLSSQCMDAATREGHLPLLQYLHSRGQSLEGSLY